MKNMLTLLMTGFVIGILFLFPIPGQANNEMLGFYVTPEFPESQVEGSSSYFDLNLAPNSKESLSIKLQNASNNPIKVKITPHTAYTNVHGVVEYGRDAVDPDSTLIHSLDTLFDPIDIIALEGNEIKTIRIPIHMPKESFEGFLAGGLRLTEVKDEATDDSNTNGEGVAIKNDFAYVIGILLSNTRDSVRPDLSLLDVFANQLNYRNVVSATIQNTKPTFVNQLALEATIHRAGEKDILYQASQERMQMAPNSHFHFPISLEGDRFQSGEYTLKLKATSGDEEWKWERNFIIEADEARAFNRSDVTIDTSINWWIILSFGIVCLLLIIIFGLVIKDKKKQNK